MGAGGTAARAYWARLRGPRRAARQEGVPVPPPSRDGRVVLRGVGQRRVPFRRYQGAGARRRHRRRSGGHPGPPAHQHRLGGSALSRHFERGRSGRGGLSRFGQNRRRRGGEERRLQDRNLCRPRPPGTGRLLRRRERLDARRVMHLLEVKNLHVEVDGKQILNGLELSVSKGTVHAIMGPNGSGKSTLAHVLAGKDDYVVTQGQVLLDGEDILALPPEERAAKGLFLAFQYPLEIPGVATMTFLRTALNAQRKQRGEGELSTPEFLKRVRAGAGKLGIEQEMLRRGVNVGFSGGEKKRNEILQMALLEPRLCVLDETDSGLDIDALKIVSDGVNRLRSPDRAFVVITHYQRLLNYIVPDVVHVLSRGRIVRTGDKALALDLERVDVEPGIGLIEHAQPRLEQ